MKTYLDKAKEWLDTQGNLEHPHFAVLAFAQHLDSLEKPCWCRPDNPCIYHANRNPERFGKPKEESPVPKIEELVIKSHGKPNSIDTAMVKIIDKLNECIVAINKLHDQQT